ncbi:MAG: type II secretion system protein GspK [Thermodesulfovibrionia bacterium]|nr:type II secretion system protein GspK [Thermodesulfovibrionia bacterium]
MIKLETHLEIMGGKKGIALVAVLWVLAILMVIVLSFSFAVRVETHSTLSFKEDMEKRFLAEAGIERGIMEVFYRNANKGQRTILEGMEVWNIDGKPYRVQTDNGFYTVSITDESGKVDINTTPDVILRNLLINLGLELENVDTIVDSIMDWKDPDELHRLHGAESDYYMLLPNPYKVKNANFDTLEELLMVNGVTPEILYRSKEKKGIIDFLTVNSGTGAININAASREVLMAVPGITPEVADEIINQRQIKEISYFQGIKGIPEENYPLVEPYVTTEGAHTFAIESVGYKGNKKAGYGIKAIVVVVGDDDKYEYLYYKKGYEGSRIQVN